MAWLEPVMVPHWVRGNEWAAMISPRNKTLHMVGLGNSVGTNGTVITAPVFVVQSFTELTQNCSKANGTIVLFNAPWTGYGSTVAYRSGAPAAAAACGAVATLVRAVAPYGIQTPHTGGTSTGPIPAASVSIEDALQMQRMQDRGWPITVQLYMEAQMLPPAQSYNLIIQVTGSEFPQEYVLVGGHSDSWDADGEDGAMDDLGGCVASWEGAYSCRQPATHGSEQRPTVCRATNSSCPPLHR